MELGRYMGLFVIIPASVLLTLSFFVLFALRKVDAKGKQLHLFGYVVAACLWIAVALFLGTGIYILTTAKYPFRKTMHMISQAHGATWCMKMHQAAVQGKDMPAMPEAGKRDSAKRGPSQR